MAKGSTIRQARYDSTHCKGFYLKLNNVYDSDIIDKLSGLESKQGYIKQLIRQDLARTCSVPGSSVPVSFGQASMDMLKEKAAAQGISVPDLIAVIVNEQLLRT